MWPLCYKSYVINQIFVLNGHNNLYKLCDIQAIESCYSVILQDAMSREIAPEEEFEEKRKDVGMPTTEKQDGTCIPTPEMDNDASLDTRSTTLIHVSDLATKIYRIGLVQLIFGIFIFCGMVLYLGLILVEMARSYSYFGENCDDIYESWIFFEVDEGYIIAAIVTGFFVSFLHILSKTKIFIYR